MKMLISISLVGIAAVGCANDPQYIDCGTADTKDACKLDSANAMVIGGAKDSPSIVVGSLHIPVRPETADLTKKREDLQKTLPADVEVPLYRVDQYDISVEYTVLNLDDKPGTVKVALDAANEKFAWDPTMIMPGGGHPNTPFDGPGKAPRCR